MGDMVKGYLSAFSLASNHAYIIFVLLAENSYGEKTRTCRKRKKHLF